MEISGDVSPDVSPNITPQPQKTDKSPDVMPHREPVVTGNGKITINTNPSGGGGDTGVNISDVVANLTDEEKQSITQLEVISDVQSFEWVNELPNIEELTVGENASVEELDLSGNISITKLDTHGANVKSVNVSG